VVNFPEATLAALALLSLALAFWQWLAARRFPLHRRAADFSFAPAITLLKPLKGCNTTTAASLQSWFDQNYSGQIQILFGVADAGDPVCQIVRELIKKIPAATRSLSAALNHLAPTARFPRSFNSNGWPDIR
jgi:hypothetical protein